MRSLSTYEMQAVSGGSLDILDLGYLWAGYNHLGLSYAALTGASIGFSTGLFNIVIPSSSNAVIGLSSSAAMILIPTLMCAGLATLEYYVGHYAASWVEP